MHNNILSELVWTQVWNSEFCSGRVISQGSAAAMKKIRKLTAYPSFWMRIDGRAIPTIPGFMTYTIKSGQRLLCSITRTKLLAEGSAPWFKVWYWCHLCSNCHMMDCKLKLLKVTCLALCVTVGAPVCHELQCSLQSGRWMLRALQHVASATAVTIYTTDEPHVCRSPILGSHHILQKVKHLTKRGRHIASWLSGSVREQATKLVSCHVCRLTLT